MLRVEQLEWAVNSTPILSAIDCAVNSGDLLVVIGPNGSGKSSLLRCCVGWLTPTHGTVTVNGEAIHSLSARARSEHLAWLPQRPTLSEPLEVVDVVANARFRHPESRKHRREMARKALAQFDVSHLANRMWPTLSGGEAQRVNLASLWAQQATLWLLDEPTNHLDPAVQQTLFRQLVDHWLAGQTMVIVTHNLNLVRAAVPDDAQGRVTVLGLKNGRTSFSTPLNADALSQQLADLYEVNVDTVMAFGRPQWVFGVRP